MDGLCDSDKRYCIGCGESCTGYWTCGKPECEREWQRQNNQGSPIIDEDDPFFYDEYWE